MVAVVTMATEYSSYHGNKVYNFRSVAVVGRNGGKECDYSSLKKEIPCNRFCMNDGTVGNKSCNCLTGWEGECCDDGNFSLRLLSLFTLSLPSLYALLTLSLYPV